MLPTIIATAPKNTSWRMRKATGTEVRHVLDKDAVTATMMIAKWRRTFCQGITHADAIDQPLSKYGWFAERTLNLSCRFWTDWRK